MNPRPLTNFRWLRVPKTQDWESLVSDDGQEELWLPGEPSDDPNITEVVGDASSETWVAYKAERKQRRYDPLASENGAMFLNFANLDGSKENFLNFAHSYGRLGLAEELPVLIPAPFEGMPVSEGEHFDTWRDAWRLMRLGVLLWKADRNADRSMREEAREARRQLEKEIRTLVLPGRKGAPRLGEERVPMISLSLERLNPDPPTWLQDEADPFLSISSDSGKDQDFRKTTLKYLVNRGLGSDIAPQLVLGERFEYQIVPQTLWSFMWDQLARAIVGSHKFIQCPRCAKWLEIDGFKRRSNSRYCNNTCKEMAKRARKERALELHHQGRAPQAIEETLVEEFGYRSTRVPTIERWIREDSGS